VHGAGLDQLVELIPPGTKFLRSISIAPGVLSAVMPDVVVAIKTHGAGVIFTVGAAGGFIFNVGRLDPRAAELEAQAAEAKASLENSAFDRLTKWHELSLPLH
jgi:hypothetical protein